MRQESCITNMEDLHAWFEANQKGEKRPYFTIYRGTEQKPDRMVFRNETEGETDAAWDMMENMLEMQSGHNSLFRVFITTVPKGNVGMSTLFRVANGAVSNAGVAGIGSFGIYGSLGEMVRSEVDKERKMWELERRLEDMQAAQDAKVGQMESFLEDFKPVLVEWGRMLGARMLGGNGAAPHVPPPMAGNHIQDAGDDLPEYDYDRIDPALDKLRRVFPDPETALEKMSKWATENPEMAKQLLQTI